MKMFVVVRKDLTPQQQAVQAGHALAEFLLKMQTKWDNGTLVYLGVNNLDKLEEVAFNLRHKGVPHQSFFEPDMAGERTAIACAGYDEAFKKLNLM